MTLQTEMGNIIRITKVFFLTLSQFNFYIMSMDNTYMASENNVFVAAMLIKETKELTPEAISSRLLYKKTLQLVDKWFSCSHGDLLLLCLKMCIFVDLYILWLILYFYTLVGVAWGSPKALALYQNSILCIIVLAEY